MSKLKTKFRNCNRKSTRKHGLHGANRKHSVHSHFYKFSKLKHSKQREKTITELSSETENREYTQSK